jgi:hypothetical protein
MKFALRQFNFLAGRASSRAGLGPPKQSDGSSAASPRRNPENFSVSILKNGIERVVYGDKIAVTPNMTVQNQTWRSLRPGG